MKLNKIMMVAVVALGISSVAHAASDQGHGKVTFTGSIIDAPCSITPETIDQTIEMGQISKVALKNGGQSTPRFFSIDLENCDISDTTKNKVTVTLGNKESLAKNGLLGIHGDAQGASIVIKDGSGKPIELGEPGDAQKLQNGNNTLAFSAYLQGDGASAVISEGTFRAVADFTLAYQ